MENKQADIKKSSFNSYQLHDMKVIQSRGGKKSFNMGKIKIFNKKIGVILKFWHTTAKLD